MKKKSMVFAGIALVLAMFLTACPQPGNESNNGNGGVGGTGTGTGTYYDPIRPPGTTLAAQLNWLQMGNNAASGNYFLLEISGNESIAHQELSFGDRMVTIILRGIGTMRTISLEGGAPLFWVGYGVTLVLDRNTTLQEGVLVDYGGTLLMNAGSRITGQGINVEQGGFFTMYGGEIFDALGGVVNGGTFTMHGGIISGNTHGGVRNEGIFTMHGGEISGNAHIGVLNAGGTFTMNGGVISGNAASWEGGGGVRNEGSFMMHGGAISDNTSDWNGGGIYNLGTFLIGNGIVHGNNAALGLRNTADNGAALYNSGTAHWGMFNNDIFVQVGDLSTTNFTIHVVNGVAHIPVMGGNLAEQLEWLRNFAESYSAYTIEINSDESIAPETLYFEGRSSVTINLRGGGAVRTISLSENGSLFTVGQGVTLVLDSNISLQGRGGNNTLVFVNYGGTLVMNEGSKITDNGGGNLVSINSGGSLVMNAGSRISDNGSHWVLVDSGGSLVMNAGSRLIGGVDNRGTFTMHGGAISGRHGGWVNNSGTFRISNGTIYSSVAAEGMAYRTTFYNAYSAQAQIGRFSHGDFTQTGELTRAYFTVRVENGVLQLPQEYSFDLQLAWLRNLAQSGGEYLIEINADKHITPSQAELPGWYDERNRTDITITLRGSGAMRTLKLSENGSLFRVGSGVSLVLDSNISLNGMSGNNSPLVYVRSGGTLVMNEGSRVTGNTNTATWEWDGGGGVAVWIGGTFIMHGGEISGNTGHHFAGGVWNRGTFIMHGGEISGNTATATGDASGGVWNDGTFTMHGGEISGNTSGIGSGGIWNNGTFTMRGGAISGNTWGGVWNGGTFTMRGGEISGNTGSGVWNSGSFDLGSGVWSYGTFQIADGLIHGSDAAEGLRNTADYGAALVNEGMAQYGTFASGVFTPSGNLSTTNFTIHVVNGIFQLPPRAGGLAEHLAWIRSFAQSGGEYTIEISRDEDIAPWAYWETPPYDLTVILRGSGAIRTINLTETGSLFVVDSGVTLVLGNNITLNGREYNWYPLVLVNGGGTLIMYAGSRITGNHGGGVSVGTDGTFTMHGGEISGNTAGLGGGGVSNDGTFTMHGGEISGNTTTNHSSGGGVSNDGTFIMHGGVVSGNTAAGRGGGVYNRSTFTMRGGEISGNTAGWGVGGGGGVFNDGTFTMHGGEISGNTSAFRGGGVSNHSTFTMHGGEISSNTAVQGGGVSSQSTFTMHGGEISGNIATYDGGGVINLNTFTMHSGEISGNTANYGGGVSNFNAFTMHSGEISGNTATYHGGGVVNWGDTFTMYSGEISGNTANYGGGVSNSVTFTMRGGAISGNSANSGGGVYLHWQSHFRMTDGIIHGTGTGGLINVADTGAVLYIAEWQSSTAQAQYGIINLAGTFIPSGDLITTDNTIEVVNGVLVSGPLLIPTFVTGTAGGQHTLAIAEDGSLWAWGRNEFGQLGDGTTNDRHSPIRIGADNDWVSVSANLVHSAAIRVDGSLWTWGSNAGRLGDGTTTNRHSPIQVQPGTTWAYVSTGRGHTMGIRADGSLWAWGSNGNGRLGDGTWTNRNSPVQIQPGTTWSRVAAGEAHTAAIRTDGTLWTWGWNGQGQLGTGDDGLWPVQVHPGTTWAHVAVQDHTVAIRSDGTLWAWGANWDGGIGDGTGIHRSVPVEVQPGTTWVYAAAYRHTMAIRSDGTLWAWGRNAEGQIGNGTGGNFFDSQPVPVQVLPGTTWASASAGHGFSMAFASDGSLWVWGMNRFGEFGDGTTNHRFTPAQISP